MDAQIMTAGDVDQKGEGNALGANFLRAYVFALLLEKYSFNERLESAEFPASGYARIQFSIPDRERVNVGLVAHYDGTLLVKIGSSPRDFTKAYLTPDDMTAGRVEAKLEEAFPGIFGGDVGLHLQRLRERGDEGPPPVPSR